SAVCVTGLAVVPPDAWSTTGKVILLVLIQLGGIGIMTLASMVAVFFSQRLALRSRLVALGETGVQLGELRSVLKGVITVTVIAEVLTSVVLTLRFWTTDDVGFGRALWWGVFHAVSAWNNAGFSLFDDNLASFAGDFWVLAPVSLAVFIGALGLPVLLDIRRYGRQRRQWSLHTKLTLATTTVLAALGGALFLLFEWNNPATIGPMAVQDKAMSGGFASVMTRTAGFNSVDLDSLESPTTLLHTFLMFVGGGSGSTAGGIKVSTLAVLVLVVWAELRGNRDPTAFRRRIPATVQREAVAVAVIAMASVFVVVFALLATVPRGTEPLDVLFEAFSAFGTVGLSTGLTPRLDGPGQILVIGLMFLGRLGPITLGTALVFNNRERLFRYAEDRPIIG
ncbi:MAG: potassium transporter TrkG, partial [Actinomycetota bacterium]|nr:potassium transporter TrkG [Actinomycetota bacterium]